MPLSLLLEADPDVEKIKTYLSNSLCFAATQDANLVGASLFKKQSSQCIELMNIAVTPSHQALGIGSKLLSFAISELKQSDFLRIELGTGTFGHQLSFYQRLGFRVDSIIKNHFLDNYSKPIFENGIQHKDMLRLVLSLQDRKI
ncbi:GNAT family N-acetyltransferase [Pseudoalteromonas sp. SSM20]|uniref:GNAT family N-acetyltransferase n=1 Tax=Pseudoalteromonas sp. SSM20 TaxID=3139394 RepID=UPI003BAC2191